MMSKVQILSLDVLRLDGGTQARVATHEETVEEYAQLIEPGAEWPFGPIDVFHDGTEYFVADGFHRTLAAQRQKRSSIPCVVHKGTAKDAKIFGMTANDTHGLRMTREDKRACVLWLLEQEGMKQSEIAKKAGVGLRTVTRIMAEQNAPLAHSSSKTLGKSSAKKSKKEKPTEEPYTEDDEETDVETTDETDPLGEEDPLGGVESDEPLFEAGPEVVPTGSKKQQALAAKEAEKQKAKEEKEKAKLEKPVPGDTPEDQERNLRKMFADHLIRAIRLADILNRTVPNPRERDAIVKTLGGVKLWPRR